MKFKQKKEKTQKEEKFGWFIKTKDDLGGVQWKCAECGMIQDSHKRESSKCCFWCDAARSIYLHSWNDTKYYQTYYVDLNGNENNEKDEEADIWAIKWACTRCDTVQNESGDCKKCGSTSMVDIEKFLWTQMRKVQPQTKKTARDVLLGNCLGDRRKRDFDNDFDNDLAMALSRSLIHNDEVKEFKNRNDKRQNMQEFFFTETIESMSLPFWCSFCGWLNSSGSKPLRSGWDVYRMWCANSLCQKERQGFWECSKCTFENEVTSYDFKYNLSNDPPPCHKCKMCETSTRKIVIKYYNDGLLTMNMEQETKFRREYQRAHFEDEKEQIITTNTESFAESIQQKRERQLHFLKCTLGELRSHSDTNHTTANGAHGAHGFELDHLTPVEIVKVLHKFSQSKIIDCFCLQLVLSKKIQLCVTDDWGDINSYWKDLALLFKTNPDFMQLCCWMIEQQFFMGRDSLCLVLMYHSNFFHERNEKCLRKFINALCDVFFEQK